MKWNGKKNFTLRFSTRLCFQIVLSQLNAITRYHSGQAQQQQKETH